ncbi:MAG TPA: serine/threonine-protein kinase [Gemmataceae bacterium]|jgi:hypothetical protein|nr:serine/threonine-protein kinase [Gemmataceae bacterium]
MNSDDAANDVGKLLADLLARLDASLVTGGDAGPEPDLPPNQLCLYRLAEDGLLRLEQAWPRNYGSGAKPTASEAASFDVLAGTGRVGKFRILRELGRGGSGIVFLAADTAAERDVALKLPRLEALVDPDLRQRFLVEARLALGLDHPGLVPVLEAGEVGAVCYIASEYAGETTLAAWLESRLDPVPVRTAAALVAALAKAVEYLHEHHVLHRDIKPSNVLLGKAPLGALPDPELAGPGVPRLTDFGLAKLLDVAAPASAGGTTGGLIVGTAEYMAPEQAEGGPERLARAADVYALGAVLCELVTGQPPFRGRNKFDTLRKVLTEEPPRLRRLRPDVPRELDAVCLKCLEKHPGRRYATAGELADDLQRFLAGQRPHARPVPWWGPVWKWARRRPTGAALAVLAALLPFGLLWALRSHDRSVRRAQAEELRATLYTANAGNLSPVIRRLRDELPTVGDDLRRTLADPAAPAERRLRAALVLAPEDESAVGHLRREAVKIGPAELVLICEALALRPDGAAEWGSIFRDSGAAPGPRLRARRCSGPARFARRLLAGEWDHGGGPARGRIAANGAVLDPAVRTRQGPPHPAPARAVRRPRTGRRNGVGRCRPAR